MAVSSEHPYSDAYTNYLAVTLHMLSKKCLEQFE